MIKLIAADMDGTLLNDNKELPPDFFETVAALSARGIRFAAASGRPYYNLKDIFQPVAGEMTFLCENGAAIFKKDAPIFADRLSRESLIELSGRISKIPEALPVFCGLDTAYFEKGRYDPARFDEVLVYFNKYKYIDNILEVDDQICKIAVYDRIDAETNSYPVLRKLTPHYKVTLSGKYWVDLMNQGVNKGSALHVLQRRYGISFDETMVFGDYLNDLELMGEGFYSFAMENAHPDLKKVSRFEAPSNEDRGVMQVIRESVLPPSGPAVREIPFQSRDYQAALRLRDQVLRRPLGLSLFDEDLSGDLACRHIAAFEGERLVGCLSLMPDGEGFRMKQVAVDPDCREKGIGRKMAGYAFKLLKQKGISLLTVHARKTAVGFYEKLGFSVTGDEFREVGIPHLPMEKRF